MRPVSSPNQAGAQRAPWSPRNARPGSELPSGLKRSADCLPPRSRQARPCRRAAAQATIGRPAGGSPRRTFRVPCAQRSRDESPSKPAYLQRMPPARLPGRTARRLAQPGHTKSCSTSPGRTRLGTADGQGRECWQVPGEWPQALDRRRHRTRQARCSLMRRARAPSLLRIRRTSPDKSLNLRQSRRGSRISCGFQLLS
jgi:hypothetical protein